MELLYVWIEEYNNIKRQGFNFSPKHHFHFEPNEKEGPVTGGTLTHKKINTSYPDNFFGEHISNITAIVGKNGSGKSSLIDFIVSAGYLAHNNLLETSFVFIAQHEGLLKRYSNERLRHNITTQIEEFENNDFYPTNKGSHHILYYSSALNSNEKKFVRNNTETKHVGNSYVVNVSSDYLLETAGHPSESELKKTENPKHINPSLASFRLQEKKKQIEFFSAISKIKKKDKYIPFDCPSKFFLQIMFSFPNGIEHQKGHFINQPHPSESKIDRADIEKYLYYTLLSSFYGEKEKGVTNYDGVKDAVDQRYNPQDFIEAYAAFLDSCISSTITQKGINVAEAGYSKGILYTLRFEFDITNFNKNLFRIIEHIESNPHDKNWLKHLKPFILWNDISDGETTLLSIFARIWDEHKKKDNSFTTCIFDEPDTSLHPEWQQSLVDRFKNFFSLLGEKKKYHLIITSHSPIVISDLPRENVIFLDKNASGECVVKEPKDMDRTFGANIHSLYRSSFFMNGLMGKFAEGKINDVIIFLNEVPKKIYRQKELERKRDEADFIITQIGEPLIREMLRKQFNEVFYSNKNIDERITKLEREIRMLKLKKRRK